MHDLQMLTTQDMKPKFYIEFYIKFLKNFILDKCLHSYIWTLYVPVEARKGCSIPWNYSRNVNAGNQTWDPIRAVHTVNPQAVSPLPSRILKNLSFRKEMNKAKQSQYKGNMSFSQNNLPYFSSFNSLLNPLKQCL